MSNYQARHRAIRAERAAQRCVQLVEEMRRECRLRMDLHRHETSAKFKAEHAHMQAQMDHLLKAATDAKRCSIPFIRMDGVPA